ncbi:MAG: hypothetical protein ACP5HQ_05590 [Thermoprotei archaeon]
MSVEEALAILNSVKGKVDKRVVEKVLNDVLDEYLRSKSVKEAIIVGYALNADLVRQNREVFDALAKALERLSSKLGLNEAVSVVISYV